MTPEQFDQLDHDAWFEVRSKEILDKLSEHHMHVHEISDQTPVLFHVTNYMTHYVMQGAEIVHRGNVKTVESFALQLPPLDAKIGLDNEEKS